MRYSELPTEIAVLKDGELQGIRSTQDMDKQTLTGMMLGRETTDARGETDSKQRADRSLEILSGRKLLEVRGLTKSGSFRNVSFDLMEGEILGVAGLLGSGKDVLGEAIFGAVPIDQGQLSLGGQGQIQIAKPAQAIGHRIAYLPEDRHGKGLMNAMSVGENILVGNLKKIAPMGILNRQQQIAVSNEYIDTFKIKTIGHQQSITALSGGNQQKVLFARLINMDCNILILCEPSRGIDVMVKEEMHRLMIDFVRGGSGRGIVMISSELPELVSASDRVMVMKNGRIAAMLTGDEINESSLLTHML